MPQKLSFSSTSNSSNGSTASAAEDKNDDEHLAVGGQLALPKFITLSANFWQCERKHRNYKWNRLTLSDDQLTIKHKGCATGTLRSKLPVPQLRNGIFYFEMFIKRGSYNISVGLSTSPLMSDPYSVCLNCFGTFCVGCFGGHCYAYGPCFQSGDWIGCGVRLTSRQLFFTRNGKFLGVATTLPRFDQQSKLYPVISMQDRAIVETNFGKKPFKFQMNMVE